MVVNANRIDIILRYDYFRKSIHTHFLFIPDDKLVLDQVELDRQARARGILTTVDSFVWMLHAGVESLGHDVAATLSGLKYFFQLGGLVKITQVKPLSADAYQHHRCHLWSKSTSRSHDRRMRIPDTINRIALGLAFAPQHGLECHSCWPQGPFLSTRDVPYRRWIVKPAHKRFQNSYPESSQTLDIESDVLSSLSDESTQNTK